MIQLGSRCWPWPVVLILVLAATPHSASAADLIRIENVQWGFDGDVIPHAFNPLSFEIYNDSNEQEEFELVLRRSNGPAPVDAPIVQPLLLAPESSRRVQMFPYITNGWSDWTLTWGRGEHQRFRLNDQRQLTLGAPATVVLFDPLAVTPPGGGGLPRFNEEFFPISVSGTSGLAGAVLDHGPRSWQTIRAQAFLDWLYSGGTVHLLQSSDGVWPEFQAPLEELNTPLDEFRIGAGLVVRHPITFARLNRVYADENMIPRQALQRRRTSETNAPQQYYVNWDTGELMFSRLKKMTQADHNWILIYIMALAYLLLIFPGCWLIGRRRADYRVTYGVMIGTVVLFSMGFKQVGQRGYGEATALHTTTIARPLEDGKLWVQQWTNLFVTDGDDYSISHPGDGLLYSSGQTNEGVNGVIVNPPGGSFHVDVPPFSSRTIASSAVLSEHPFGVTATRFEADDSQFELDVQFDPDQDVAVREMAVQYRGMVYPMSARNGLWSKSGSGELISRFLRTDTWNEVNYGMGIFGPSDDSDPDELFQAAMRPLVARNLMIHNEETLNTTILANDRARLFVYADMPEELSPHCEYVDGAAVNALVAGRILYVIDLFPPEDAEP